MPPRPTAHRPFWWTLALTACVASLGCGVSQPGELDTSASDAALTAGSLNDWSCHAPARDYSRVQFRGVTLNRYTISLIHRAEAIAQSKGLPTPFSFYQGSYNSSVGASAGTHSGGGAVDVVINGNNRSQYEGIAAALREAGFAAWHRQPPAFIYHIHAIALGDTDASSAARNQVRDYAEGRDGLADRGPDGDASVGRHAPAWANIAGGQKCDTGGGGGVPTGGSCVPGGLYCSGDKVTGDARTLYRCNGRATPTVVQRCASACLVRAGQDDVCR